MSAPYSLIGQRVALHPLQRDHADALVAASLRGDLWRTWLTSVPSAENIAVYLDKAFAMRDDGSAEPFVIRLTDSGEIVGCTRFCQIDRDNRKREIGHTWIAAPWQGGFVNPEVKYLMLRHAFERQQCLRVQLQTDALNAQSRAAILKLGATQEGILRNDRIMPDGRIRDSVLFSIMASEWPDVRNGLEARLTTLGTTPSFAVNGLPIVTV